MVSHKQWILLGILYLPKTLSNVEVLALSTTVLKLRNNLAITNPVEHFGPPLHGNTLVDSKHGKANVIKVGDAIVGTFPAWPTLRAVDDAAASVTSLSTGCR